MGRWRKYIRISLAFHLVLLALVGLAVQQKLLLAPSNHPVQIDIVPLGDGQGGGGSAGAAAGKGQGKSAAMNGAGNVMLPELADATSEEEKDNLPLHAAPQEGVKEPHAFPGNETGDRNSPGTTTGKTGPGGPTGQQENPDRGRSTIEGAGIQNARVLSFAKQYPLSAWQNGEEGSCLIQVDVSAAGTITGARLLSSTGYDRLDQAAIRSAFQSSYAPARDGNGNPVAGRLNIPVQYRLTDGPS